MKALHVMSSEPYLACRGLQQTGLAVLGCLLWPSRLMTQAAAKLASYPLRLTVNRYEPVTADWTGGCLGSLTAILLMSLNLYSFPIKCNG